MKYIRDKVKVVTYIDSEELHFQSFSHFTKESKLSDKFFENESGINFLFSDIKSRLFFNYSSDLLFVSDNLNFLAKHFSLTISDDSEKFYLKFGFILPPFTQYKDVFLISPFTRFHLNNSGVIFNSEFQDLSDQSDNNNLNNTLTKYFNHYSNHNLDILVSGGIDSSALLGYLKQNYNVRKTFMCKMSSLPNEGKLAEELSQSINVPFESINLDIDLSNRALEFVSESGEYISDSIALVFPELFSKINSENKKLYIVDGQGADSLLNGLPLNKVYDVWEKVRPIKYLLYPLSLLPIYKNKSTPLKRKLYRLSKAIKCLSQLDFKNSILLAMIEKEMPTLKLEIVLLNELDKLYEQFGDWHLVLRVLYLYRVLPAREMQKYLFSKKYNIEIVAPFLDEKVIKSLLFLNNEELIKDGLYKYPITKMAQKYWPNKFEKSKTSPFQVNYRIGFSDLKEYSINFFKN